MFGRKKEAENSTAAVPENEAGDDSAVANLKPDLPKGKTMSSDESSPASQLRPDIPRRVAEVPGPGRGLGRGSESDDTKKLIVGREIRLSGEITACDRLVVEGRVEANLSDSSIIEITSSGYFKGTAEVEEAVISGEFQGTLNVRSRLFVKATGKVSGDIRYGELEIERGGRVSGNIDQNGGKPAVRPTETPGTFAAEGD